MRHYAASVGIPSGRCFPPAFGIYTRLTGLGVHDRERSCAQLSHSALPWDNSTVLPSMPAVLRPALSSVTRRTLISALARIGASASADCGLSSSPLPVMPRRSAAADAVRPPRPAASPQRPSPGTRPRVRSPHHRLPRPRPLPIPLWRPTCPSVPVSSVIKSSQAHPTHVSALSGRAIKTRIRAVMRHRRREAAALEGVFPSPFGVPASASRVILFPLRS